MSRESRAASGESKNKQEFAKQLLTTFDSRLTISNT